ncbi:MAG TPA: serine/threonine-protein kinase, partial [Fibrobacteria bacterium]|nr:serine/threonine-protein kinase [Fibrobacteria bacterium]
MEKSAVKGPSDRDHLIDTQFGGYTIVERLGTGGMGDVYKAIQTGLDRPVALKILPSLLARSQEFSDRFMSEAFAISRLQHQNIVTIYDYGEENGQKFIAMQYIQGITLSKIIHDEKKLDYPRIIAIAKQIGRGLKYAHDNDIVHRDIKSGNIMVEPGDKIYISDFGIAKVIDAPSITTTGMAMGTPEYMAPEQCEGGVVDGQSDIYGLGCILFEMVSGKPPFLADTPLAVAYKQVHETPPLLSKRCPDVPPRLELIVVKCLKKSKEERYRTADDLLKDLDNAHLETSPPRAAATMAAAEKRITDRRGRDRRHGPAPLAPSRAYLAGTLGLFALTMGAIALLWFRPGPEASQGLHWLDAASAEGETHVEAPATALKPSLLLDGDRATIWAYQSEDPKDEGEVVITFPGLVLLSGMVLEAGPGHAVKGSEANVAMGFPKSVTLEAEGRKPLRFT